MANFSPDGERKFRCDYMTNFKPGAKFKIGWRSTCFIENKTGPQKDKLKEWSCFQGDLKESSNETHENEITRTRTLVRAFDHSFVFPVAISTRVVHVLYKCCEVFGPIPTLSVIVDVIIVQSKNINVLTIFFFNTWYLYERNLL